MDLLIPLVLVLLGAIIGLMAGFFGIGGGVLMVPILLELYKYSGVNSMVLTQITFGTSLFIMIFASISSAYKHNSNKNVIWKAVFIIGLSSTLSAMLGAYWAAQLKGEILQKIFSAILLFTAIRMFIKTKDEDKRILNLNFSGLVVLGIGLGIISTLAGLGGGVLSIPIMYHLFKFPIKKAIGTSSAIIVITAIAGTFGYIYNGLGNPNLPPHTIGFIDYRSAIAMIIGSIPFSQVGAHYSNKMHSGTVRIIFACLLICVSIKIFIFG